MPTITLPDGTQKAFEQSVTVAEVAASIGAGLASAALAGRVNDALVDTSFAIQTDSELSIITARDEEGVDVLRHSCAHLMAQAVQQLFPGAQVTIGPTIEDGFYYDFAYERPFTPEDLEKIEKKMLELAKAAQPVTRSEMSRDEAVALFKEKGEDYKVQILESIPGDEVLSFYQQGEFIDLCRGLTFPTRGSSKRSSSPRLQAPTGEETRTTRCCSASMAPPGEIKKHLRIICFESRKQRSAITESWVNGWIFSTFRILRQAWCFGIQEAGKFGRC